MVSKLLVSRATLPFHRITRSHTSSSSNFFFFSLASSSRATFQRAPSRRGGGKAEGNFARERQVSSDIQTRRERNRCHPPLPFKQAKATISHSSSYLLCHRENLREPCRPPTNQPFHASTLDRSTLLIPLSRSPPD